MSGNFGEALKLVGYIAITVVIGAIGIAIKESVGGIFEIAIIIIGWAALIWIWTIGSRRKEETDDTNSTLH